MPMSFQETASGILMAADGMGEMLRWDGSTAQMEIAGLPAPTTAPTMTASGRGNIAGTYYAYLRFVDRDGNTSDLSPVSTALTPATSTGTIELITATTPVQIFSTNHGLTTGTRLTLGGTILTYWTQETLTIDQARELAAKLNAGQLPDQNGRWDVLSGAFVHSDGSLFTWKPNAFNWGTHYIRFLRMEVAGTSTSDEITYVPISNNSFTITVLDKDRFTLDDMAPGGPGGPNVFGNSILGYGGLWSSGASTISYTGIQITNDPKVVSRQILRNTAGQTSTFYVDVDTTDLTNAGTFTSTREDSELSVQTAVPLLDLDGRPLANRFAKPPTSKSVLAHHMDRMFAAVDTEYSDGCVSVTFGSATVTGIGTEWTSVMAGRYFSAVGSRKKDYLISSVSTSAQTLTLSTVYTSASDAYLAYSVHSAPADKRTIMFTEAGLPEAWPAINGITLQNDGDQLTGLMVKGSFIYVLEKRHTYRFTFQNDPAKDGYMFMASNRGCINNRCWVTVDDVSYMLDDLGIYAFGGGQEVEPISQVMQEMFEPRTDTPWRINWTASKHFHAAHFPSEEVVRWFLALAGSTLPRHALAYDYRQKSWWIEEYQRPVASSCVGLLNGLQQVYLGSHAKKVLAASYGYLDGVDASLGTVRGTVTASTLDSITDSAATFGTSTLVNSPVTIVAGTGKGQTRQVVAVASGKISVDRPWMILPDTTSTYQLGGIPWLFRTGIFAYAIEEQQNLRRIHCQFKPLSHATSMDIRVYENYSDSAVVWHYTRTSADGNGVAVTDGSSDIVADLTKTIGYVQHRMDGHREPMSDGPRVMQVELAGVSNQELVVIHELGIDGVRD